ncbi:hypothetical protein VTN49DRAFT_4486 [Thermomyces lanuginosus]|uniref:uncharacterized protein n=1 Tax=Thermomyces lanuginosus TaxID=5541 RepID=UPI00374445FE
MRVDRQGGYIEKPEAGSARYGHHGVIGMEEEISDGLWICLATLFEISPSLPVASEKEHHHLDLVEGARTSMDCGCVQSFARRESLERDRRKRKQRDILTTMKAHT